MHSSSQSREQWSQDRQLHEAQSFRVCPNFTISIHPVDHIISKHQLLLGINMCLHTKMRRRKQTAFTRIPTTYNIPYVYCFLCLQNVMFTIIFSFRKTKTSVKSEINQCVWSSSFYKCLNDKCCLNEDALRTLNASSADYIQSDHS